MSDSFRGAQGAEITPSICSSQKEKISANSRLSPNVRILIFFRAVFCGVIAREASILQHRCPKKGDYSH
jgi:hypothetical protein